MPKIPPVIATQAQLIAYMGKATPDALTTIPQGEALGTFLNRCLSWSAQWIVNYLDRDYTTAQEFRLVVKGDNSQGPLRLPEPIGTLTSVRYFDPTNPAAAAVVVTTNFTYNVIDPWNLYAKSGLLFEHGKTYEVIFTRAAPVTYDETTGAWPEPIVGIHVEMAAHIFNECSLGRGDLDLAAIPDSDFGTAIYRKSDLPARWRAALRQYKRYA